MSGQIQAIAQQMQTTARKAAIESAGSRLSQILSINDAGGYDVQFSDGQGMSNIHNQGSTKWQMGQWVTLNKVSGMWVIVGAGAAHA